MPTASAARDPQSFGVRNNHLAVEGNDRGRRLARFTGLLDGCIDTERSKDVCVLPQLAPETLKISDGSDQMRFRRTRS
jgi:hypothetical protein